MADSESGIRDLGNMETGSWPGAVFRDANWPEEDLNKFFGDIEHEVDQIYLDNVSVDTITTFHHEGRMRTLTRQELIDLLWGNDDG